jgi:hypothetical protein
MNDQEPLQPPWHFNSQYKLTTQLWNGMDSEERFNNHLGDKKSADRLQRMRWDADSITYKFNSMGFRCDNFDNRPCGIALGCSFTQGVGLPLKATWPSVLSELCGIHVWNLGVGGASTETVFRIFEYFVTKLTPKFVCVLMPPAARLEYQAANGAYPIIMPMMFGQHPSFAKDWLSQESNGKLNQKKTVLAMERVCDILQIPLMINDSQSDSWKFSGANDQSDLARDLAHPGYSYQYYQADSMFNKLVSNSSLKNQ